MQVEFEVGQSYTNRLGPYEVLSVEGDNLTIQYEDGTEATVSAAAQARIAFNMRIDKRVAKQLAEAKTTRRTRRSGGRRPRGRSFKGLVSGDFKDNITGTKWRSRTHTGGALANGLTAATEGEVQSYPVYRQPIVHLARPDRYDKGKRHVFSAKLFLELNEERARYGFYVEKSDDPMDETWDWGRFLDALEGDAALTAALGTTMAESDLSWRLYDDGDVQELAHYAASEEDTPLARIDQDQAEGADWSAFTLAMRDLDAGEWHNLYLCRDMPRAEVLAMGDGFVRAVVDTFRALMPLYDACTQVRSED